jgi:hypothetical protein
VLVVVSGCLAAGAALVGRPRALPVIGCAIGGLALGFWLTGVNLKLWESLATSLAPGQAR